MAPAARLPAIMIIDIPCEYSKEELLERVKNHNSSKFSPAGITLDDSNFKIIFTKAQVKRPDLYKAKVVVSEEVRRVIDRFGNKLNVGLKSCPVFDDLFVKRCNRCQTYNHYMDACPQSNPVVCGKCSENHETQSCTSATIKCHNCAKAKYDDTNHETSYYKCKAYTEAQKKLESTINYYSNRQKN